MVNSGGRPRKHTKKETKELCQKLEGYIKETDIPILAEFAYQNDINRQTLYDYSEFSTLIKKAIEKKEAQLEKLALLNVINPTLAIFSLKQLGWRDKHDIEHTGKDGGPIETKRTIDLSSLTDEELTLLERVTARLNTTTTE